MVSQVRYTVWSIQAHCQTNGVIFHTYGYFWRCHRCRSIDWGGIWPVARNWSGRWRRVSLHDSHPGPPPPAAGSPASFGSQMLRYCPNCPPGKSHPILRRRILNTHKFLHFMPFYKSAAHKIKTLENIKIRMTGFMLYHFDHVRLYYSCMHSTYISLVWRRFEQYLSWITVCPQEVGRKPKVQQMLDFTTFV